MCTDTAGARRSLARCMATVCAAPDVAWLLYSDTFPSDKLGMSASLQAFDTLQQVHGTAHRLRPSRRARRAAAVMQGQGATGRQAHCIPGDVLGARQPLMSVMQPSYACASRGELLPSCRHSEHGAATAAWKFACRCNALFLPICVRCVRIEQYHACCSVPIIANAPAMATRCQALWGLTLLAIAAGSAAQVSAKARGLRTRLPVAQHLANPALARTGDDVRRGASFLPLIGRKKGHLDSSRHYTASLGCRHRCRNTGIGSLALTATPFLKTCLFCSSLRRRVPITRTGEGEAGGHVGHASRSARVSAMEWALKQFMPPGTRPQAVLLPGESFLCTTRILQSMRLCVGARTSTTEQPFWGSRCCQMWLPAATHAATTATVVSTPTAPPSKARGAWQGSAPGLSAALRQARPVQTGPCCG